MTRPLGGIQDADHLQLGSQLQAAPSARFDHECAKAGALAGTSSWAGIPESPGVA